MSLPIRAPSTSPTSSSTAHQDSKNLVNLLNLSRRGGLVNPAAAAAIAAASATSASVAAAANASGNGTKIEGPHNATMKKHGVMGSNPTASTTIIHSDDEEMTFKQEPASPPPAPSAAISASDQPRTNGKQ